MTEGTHPGPTDALDASDRVDVVEGPVGSASLKDPNTVTPPGTDLDELPSLNRPGVSGSLADKGDPADGDPVSHERQDPDHVGVDWDLTPQTRD